MTAISRRVRMLGLGVAATIVAACATANAEPAKCIDAVRKAENDIQTRIQGGGIDQTTEREAMKVQLLIAAMAADSGKEQECWRHYQLAMIYIE